MASMSRRFSSGKALSVSFPYKVAKKIVRAGSLVGRVSLAKELARGMGRGKVSLHASY